MMYMQNQKRNDTTVQEMRRDGGIWLKKLRLSANLSQRQLAEKVGADYYTFISQLENGRGRIPPDRYEEWAEALNVPPDTFVFNVMRFYDPVTFKILFGEKGECAKDVKPFKVLA